MTEIFGAGRLGATLFSLVSLHHCGAARQPSLRSWWTNRPVTMRTKPDFRHPRTGGTALFLPTTTELVVINLIPQHDPQANPELACHRHARFSQPLLHQFAAIESL